MKEKYLWQGKINEDISQCSFPLEGLIHLFDLDDIAINIALMSVYGRNKQYEV